MKHVLCVLLVIIMVFCLCACAEPNQGQPTTEPPQIKEEDDGIMKILLIGHSLGVDSGFLFPHVAKSQGMENLVVGMLYHSGCRLSQHAQYISWKAKEYAYFEYDVSKDTQWRRATSSGDFLPYETASPNDIYISDGTIGQTMLFGIQQHDWDVVILQAGGFEAANIKDSNYAVNNSGNIRKIMDYVLKNDKNPKTKPKFAWNMTWACPDDDAVLQATTKETLYANFESRHAFYQKIASVVKEELMPEFAFSHMLPAGTVIENALSSELVSKDLYRDYYHATDFGRLMVGCAWYCVFTGTDVRDLKLENVPSQLLTDGSLRNSGTDLVLTQRQKDILIEAVENAIKTPYAMTPFTK